MGNEYKLEFFSIDGDYCGFSSYKDVGFDLDKLKEKYLECYDIELEDSDFNRETFIFYDSFSPSELISLLAKRQFSFDVEVLEAVGFILYKNGRIILSA